MRQRSALRLVFQRNIAEKPAVQTRVVAMIRRYLVLFAFLIIVPLSLRAFFSSDAKWGGVKEFFIPVAQIYLDLFNAPSTAIILSLTMAVAGFALLFYYWLWRIVPALRDLKAVSARLRLIGENPGSSSALAALDGLMTSFTIAERPWSLFRATLVENGDGRISSQFQPARYFNMKSLEQSGVRLRFFLGLPNDFVGLGLIFTFLGLVAGLYFASRSMMSSDLEAARGALFLLLNAATFKFLTSITGIGMSLILSAAQRVLLDALQARLDELQFLIESLLPLSRGNMIPVDGRPSTVLPVRLASGGARRGDVVA